MNKMTIEQLREYVSVRKQHKKMNDNDYPVWDEFILANWAFRTPQAYGPAIEK